MIATYTRRELMVVAAAREIRDHEVVFVGMRLPLLGFGLAKATHAPHAVGLFENGVIRDRPAEAFIYTMGDPPNIAGAIACLGLVDVMSLLQQGRVDVGFIGGAEIDPMGNLNTTRTSGGGSMVRLPGSGGGGDIASLAGRTVLIMEHEPRRFRPRVDYITSPGHFPGRRRGGPSTLITTLGVFNLSPAGVRVRSLHPAVTAQQVRDATGFPLQVEDSTPDTPAPSTDELAYIRRADPEGFWTGQGKPAG
ncbi:MAG TPA: CoA-transferase [Candidatus Dormibacteraeota bacterium]|jgi:glutaconate CoA-transferase subunit B|nr:CoA-transferase [Candidatus Dormibacteraeota bacterium]